MTSFVYLIGKTKNSVCRSARSTGPRREGAVPSSVLTPRAGWLISPTALPSSPRGRRPAPDRSSPSSRTLSCYHSRKVDPREMFSHRAPRRVSPRFTVYCNSLTLAGLMKAANATPNTQNKASCQLCLARAKEAVRQPPAGIHSSAYPGPVGPTTLRF